MVEHQQQQKIPVLPWMREPVDISLLQDRPVDYLPFLHPSLKEALKNTGISSLFPVQVAVWQETVGPGGFERDICVNSPTGSGKTLAYALPIVQRLANPAVKCLRALVVVPTRDLALQVKSVFDAIAPAVGLSVGLAVGQSSIADERSSLIEKPKFASGICYDPEDHSQIPQSSVDILVATPGRLMDHINTTKGFTLEHLQYLVVDEMDRLLREAYQSCLPTVLKLAQSNTTTIFSSNIHLSSPFGPLRTIRRCGTERGFRNKPSPRLCKIVLSATLTQDPGKIAQLDPHHPVLISAKRYELPETLESYEVICDDNKPLYLMALLRKLDGEKCIVFTSSKDSTRKLYGLLKFCDLQIKIQKYSGIHRQEERSKVLKEFRKGEVQVLISTDAMTRGMDVEGIRNVINYDAPEYIKTYIHRAGRTARAGEFGRCFTLLLEDEVEQFKEVLQKAENHSCATYSLSPESIESLHPVYVSVETLALIAWKNNFGGIVEPEDEALETEGVKKEALFEAIEEKLSDFMSLESSSGMVSSILVALCLITVTN
ncbi:hypothetical protein V2J09_010215 [Rumex salicifolius]